MARPTREELEERVKQLEYELGALRSETAGMVHPITYTEQYAVSMLQAERDRLWIAVDRLTDALLHVYAHR